MTDANGSESKKRGKKQNRIGVFICHCGSNIASVVDIEAASLLLKKTLKAEADGEEINRAIGKLRNERPYLFATAVGGIDTAWAGPTAGVRGRGDQGTGMLSRLAEQATRSGNRRDMQEYLRARRARRG